LPAQVTICLSTEDEKQLERILKSRKSSVRLVERAKIVLLAATNNPNYQIAEELKINVNTDGRRRNRYSEEPYLSR